jgi:transposase
VRPRRGWRVLFSVDVPRGPDGAPLLPEALWAPLDPAVQAVLVALTGQVAALTAEVRELRAQVRQHSGNSSRPPSSDPPQAPRRPPAAPSGRRPGGQPGHVAHQRTPAAPERVDRVVDHFAPICARCAAPLPAEVASAGFVAHQVTELPPVRAVVTEHRRHRVVCAACGAGTRAALPAAVPRGAFGPRLQATVALLRGQYHLSQRQVADLCGALLDTPLAPGSVAGLCRGTAAALEEPVAAVRATLPAAGVVNADETHWPRPQAGRTHWLWVAVTGLATVFTLAASRSSAVLKGLLGEDYPGVVGSDRYSGYAWLDESCRQLCWAHLRRDLQALADRGGTAQAVGAAALAVVHDLFTEWYRFRDGTLDRAGLISAMAPVQDALAAVVDAGLACSDAKAITLCRALDRLWPALWTFVDADGVDPTNNAAERALRPAVLWRKGAYGTQSDAGDRFVERLLTVVATCKQHGRSVLDYLTAVCTATQRGLSPPGLLPAPASTAA